MTKKAVDGSEWQLVVRIFLALELVEMLMVIVFRRVQYTWQNVL
jgi:hypothetical protein